MATPNFLNLAKTLDADGIFEVDFTEDNIEVGNTVLHASILLSRYGEDPTVPLNGIRLLAGGDPLEFSNSDQAWMFAIRTADGDGIVVVHMADGVDAAEQIHVPITEGPMVLTANHSFGLWRGGPTRLNLYTPTTVLNTTYATTTGTTAVETGVGEVFWSYTLAGNEAVEGTVRIIGRASDGGITHTHIRCEFAASREPGFGAVVTVKNDYVGGTIDVGATVATTADGNDIKITATHAFTGDIDWTRIVDLIRVLP